MDISYIKEFLALYKYGNYVDAADSLYMSQPSLTKHIKALEQELGSALFDRNTRRVSLSPFGKIFLPYAQKMIDTHNEAMEALEEYSTSRNNTLNLGVLPFVNSYNFVDTIARFTEENPLFKVNVLILNNNQMVQMLHQHELDLAFIRHSLNESLPGIVHLPYVTDRLIAVCPKGYFNRSSISLEELSGERLLYSSSGYIKTIVENNSQLKAVANPINFSGSVNLGSTLIDLVRRGSGVALLMRKLALCEDCTDVDVVEISPAVRTVISLCYDKIANLSHVAQKFISYTSFNVSDENILI